jgi:DNA-binding MarR family transcriptional regulator
MTRDLAGPEAESVGWPLIHAARLHRTRINSKLTHLSLFAGQEQVLQALSATESLTITELADILRVRPPTVSKMVTRLAMAGLTERHGGPDDARIVQVRLTHEGRRKAASVAELWNEVEGELLKGLERKERKRLRKMLRKVAKNLAVVTGADFHGLDGADDDLD